MAANTEQVQKHPSSPGNAGVAGAGIAGLSAAIALRRAGWHVEVFERSQFKNEVGAAITVTPNAALVLDRFGFDMEKAEAVPNQSTLLALAGDPSTILQREDYSAEGPGELGYGVWSLHRVDLHRGLQRLATRRDVGTGIGPPVEIRLGCEVMGVDCERGILKLANGPMVPKDLVIIADGAHSCLVSDFTARPSEVRRTRHSVYRWLVPMEGVKAEPELSAIYTSELPGFMSWHDPVKNILWVTYRCRGGTVLNVAIRHETQPGQGDDHPWHSPVSAAQVLSTVENFHPSIKKLVTMTSEDGINIHHLYERPPLTGFVRGCTAVIGDAAHIMPPTHAAGASIGIESAASLEVLFRNMEIGDSRGIRQRLELFDKLRIPRCNLTLLASNAGPEWLRVPGIKDEIRKFYSGPLPPPDAAPYSKPVRTVLFHHDEYRAAEELLAELQGQEPNLTYNDNLAVGEAGG